MANLSEEELKAALEERGLTMEEFQKAMDEYNKKK